MEVTLKMSGNSNVGVYFIISFLACCFTAYVLIVHGQCLSGSTQAYTLVPAPASSSNGPDQVSVNTLIKEADTTALQAPAVGAVHNPSSTLARFIIHDDNYSVPASLRLKTRVAYFGLPDTRLGPIVVGPLPPSFNYDYWTDVNQDKWEPLTLKVFWNVGKHRQGALLDFGAWIGPLTLYAIHQPDKFTRVVALEPDPVSFMHLHANLALQGRMLRDRVMLFKNCMSYKPETIQIQGNGGNSGTFLGQAGRVEVSQENAFLLPVDSQQTFCFRFEDLFEGAGLPQDISLIKFDVEGFEMYLWPHVATYLESIKHRLPGGVKPPVFLSTHKAFWKRWESDTAKQSELQQTVVDSLFKYKFVYTSGSFNGIQLTRIHESQRVGLQLCDLCEFLLSDEEIPMVWPL